MFNSRAPNREIKAVWTNRKSATSGKAGGFPDNFKTFVSETTFVLDEKNRANFRPPCSTNACWIQILRLAQDEEE
jgi:hypothetical protein